jgi:hypothetical protein
MSKPTPQQLAILAEHPDAVLHFGEKRPVKKKSRPTVLHRDGYTTIGERANYWCESEYDWWKWEGDSESDIIAYIPDPDYTQPPVESLYDRYTREMLKPRPTRQQARDMLAEISYNLICQKDEPLSETDRLHYWRNKAITAAELLDAIAGEE